MICSFSALLFASPAAALETGEFWGANTAAMGGAGLADPEDNMSVTGNPGVIGLRDRYDILARFGYGPSPHVGYGVSAVDAHTSEVIAFGATYNRLTDDPDITTAELPGWIDAGTRPTNRKRYHDVTGAVALSLLERKVGIGVNGTISWFNHDQQGKGNTGNLDAGFGLAPTDWFTLSFVGRNLVPVDDQPDRLTAVAGGIRFEDPDKQIGALEFDLDYELDEHEVGKPLSLMAGVERPLLEVGRLRGGWMLDGTNDRHLLSFGFGGENESGAFDYSVMVPLNAQRVGDAIHMVSIRVNTASPSNAPF